jgi:hypothetical protein
MKYPTVLGEFQTLQRVLNGESLARYGDGELKMADRVVGIKSQGPDARLTERLARILHDSGDCMVGIPNIRSDTPKAEHWGKYMRYSSLLGDRPYVSSFITRPDSAPWIDAPEYWAMLASLWVGQDVTLVRGSAKSFTAERLMAAGAANVTEILAPRQHAWGEYESLLDRIGTPRRALICLGPTATVMAVDLCARGVHAIDFGHSGMFWQKHVDGRPMWVTDEEKAVDRRAVVA